MLLWMKLLKDFTMKRRLHFLIIVFFLASSPSLFAADKSTDADTEKNAAAEQKQAENLSSQETAPEVALRPKNPIQKLKRGIVNVVTAPIEIAKGIDDGWKSSAKKNQPAGTGIFGGFFKGIANTIERMGSGLWDIVSFPFETPADYEPLMKPDYVLDDK